MAVTEKDPESVDFVAALLNTNVYLESNIYSRTRIFLQQLAPNPPQVLLLEGGSAFERMALSFFWAALLNCEHKNNGLPCLTCPTCTRIIHNTHRDIFFFNGLDESIKIGEVRETKSVFGEPPRNLQKRVIIFGEAQNLGLDAANTLLKVMEEPTPHNIFVFTLPQRERILPTIVSRSWVLSLPWAKVGESQGEWEQSARRSYPQAFEGIKNNDSDNIRAWEGYLADFLKTGKGWFAHSSAKGALTPAIAEGLLSRCNVCLAAFLAGKSHAAAASPLAIAFSSRLSANIAARVYELLAVCQKSLHYNVNAAYVLDFLATQILVWVEEERRREKAPS